MYGVRGKSIPHYVFLHHGPLTKSCLQAYIAVQNLVPAKQIPTAMSILIFCQNMGGAISLVAANAIFSNKLRQQLQERIAQIGISPDVIIDSGARSVRQLVSGDSLAAVLQAYSNSVDTVMYLGIAVSVAAFAFAWGLGWKDIRVERKLNAIQAQGSDSENVDVSNPKKG
jgi:hypothetical protein